MPIYSQPDSNPLFDKHEDATFRGFFLQAERVITEAQFIIDSLPNAEVPAVERAIRQLNAVKTVLLNIDDPFTTEDEQSQLTCIIQHYLSPLEAYLVAPEPANGFGVKQAQPQGWGRPRYLLDLDRAYHLHQLGISWTDIADAMGVDRKTLYHHFKREGRSTARQLFTEITDDELDEVVAEIALLHPFVGVTVMMGHLEVKGIHLPRERVRLSLGRVDAMGMLVR
jgi:AraC-like DNA-binding protein